MFLTTAQVQRLTGIVEKDKHAEHEKQAAWLRTNGVHHFVNVAGFPIVPCSAVETPWKATEGATWAPNFKTLTGA